MSANLHLHIGFIGAGKMATALAKGFIRAGLFTANQILASDPSEAAQQQFTKEVGAKSTANNADVLKFAPIIVLCVKPHHLDEVLQGLRADLSRKHLLISIVAGAPLAKLERGLEEWARVIRVMPNTPALVGAGATAMAPGEHATEDDLTQARALFEAVGMAVVVEEPLLDAVTGLSGSGPAYIFLIIEALADGGVKAGLARDQAQELAAQTVLGSAKLLIETGEHPGRLKDQVTSPGGTAIAGLHTLEAGGLRTTLMDAVEAATNRSRELGKKFLEKE